MRCGMIISAMSARATADSDSLGPRAGKPSGDPPVTSKAGASAADPFDDYLREQQRTETFDEMFGEGSEPRETHRQIHQILKRMSGTDFEARASTLARAHVDQGVTFSLSGDERPFPLDLVPRAIGADEWRLIERGISQRVRALEAFLADVYGAGEVFADRVVPRRLVTSSKHFHRAAYGITPPNGVRIHVAGVDLVRDGTGRFCVLEDNLRCPSGVSYVLENRRVMARGFPELFARARVRAVAVYPARLLRALRAAAPPEVAEPTIVVLTPGVHNSAYFEHSLLARQMGVELVEGRDLVCRDGIVRMRTTSGERRVDVIYRRIDDDFLDPMHFRPDSLIGCPGVLNAARAGNVVLANAVGNGVADDKLTYTYVPDLIQYYLNEKPLLPNVETYRLEDPDQLHTALDKIDQLVLKPVDGSGGHGLVMGPTATDEQLDAVRQAILARPRDWIAQPVVRLSSAPTFVDGQLAPRHIDLRPFAVNDGTTVWVLPGGLTRVALVEDSLVVNSSQGGGSKDTWVLTSRRAPRRPHDPDDEDLLLPAIATPLPLESRRVTPGPELGPMYGDQQQQQQQGRVPC
ncbi:MAG: hypothetical protein QOI55_1100 [Actinomycetota bacterium]|nr:hypothetical protein [Actinomycetota bacterium]